MDILDSKFIKKYKKEMVETMLQTNPSWNKKDIEKNIDRMIKDRFQNPTVILDNNYTGEKKETSLLAVFDWIIERKPIIAGNGTFYKNQNEAINPIAQMLDNFLITRKALKKEMFKIEDTSSAKYKDLDRSQQNQKINANSYYGASGAPSSAFYSEYSGPATTLTAQSVISTAENFFESFLSDNYKFININELIHWMNKIIKEDNFKIDKFIMKKSVDETYERLYDKLIIKSYMDDELLYNYLSNLSEDEITILYYKNNIINFLNDHKEIQEIFYNIMKNVKNLEKIDDNNINNIDTHGMSVKEWNSYVDKEYFMDPNVTPEAIKDELELFKKYILKYVFTKYLSFDRIYRLRNFKRRVVTVIDTDSNILSLDILAEWINDNIIKGETFGRDDEHNSFVLVNSITYVITEAIKDILLYYGEMSNVPEEYRYRFSMKNEFFMPLLIIGKSKKRYISKILLREGNLMNPPKNDIKGFDFKKATCSEYAEERFMSIIKKYIIDSSDIEVKNIIKDLRDFEDEIRTSILNGERKFLPNGSAKELAAYKDPASEQSIRGTMTWNILNPDNNIDLPAKVSLVKMNIFTEDDIISLKDKYPDVYRTIIEKIFNDETGIFVSKKNINEKVDYISPKEKDFIKQIPKKYRNKFKDKTVEDWNKFVDNYDFDDPKNFNDVKQCEVKKRGLQVLAIPSNGTIPEWAIDYIDINTMVNNIISPFKAVLEIFNSKFTSEGKTRGGVNRKTDKLTNIIKF